MKPGDRINTRRFCAVTISEVLSSAEAWEQGYREPTHYDDPDYNIYGKHTGTNRMAFAAVKKN